eukprot:comp22301_c0_seq1/m.33100 comp22301_c0_seq1/g.33100  ORF comp22301_c0_seq1/g.33100 comp22301_c0_seq1/m.33100 type:complete len:504 (-) comp22301_c0_seq1:311-1822(-)
MAAPPPPENMAPFRSISSFFPSLPKSMTEIIHEMAQTETPDGGSVVCEIEGPLPAQEYSIDPRLLQGAPDMNFLQPQMQLQWSMVAQEANPLPALMVPQPSMMLNEHNFKGRFGFDVDFGSQATDKKSKTKGVTWMYAEKDDQLYVNIQVCVPVGLQFAKDPTSGEFPPKGSYVRVKVLYKNPDDVYQPVTRCANHVDMKDCPPDQIIKLENLSVTNERDQLDHMTAKVPYDKIKSSPQLRVKYMCFSSCPAIKQRPIVTVFTLEAPSGQILGKRTVSTKICACPGRDYKKDHPEEDRPRRKTRAKKDVDADMSDAQSHVSPAPAVEPNAKPQMQLYTIHRQVMTLETYNTVQRIIDQANIVDSIQLNPSHPLHHTFASFQNVDPPIVLNLTSNTNANGQLPNNATVPKYGVPRKGKEEEWKDVPRAKTPDIGDVSSEDESTDPPSKRHRADGHSPSLEPVGFRQSASFNCGMMEPLQPQQQRFRVRITKTPSASRLDPGLKK